MYTYQKILMLFVIGSLILSGCATVPIEVCELSYTMGQDLETLHKSYKSLIKSHFDLLRKQRMDFINTRLIPHFIQNYSNEMDLPSMLKAADSTGNLEDINLWAEVAIETIEERRNELIDPINKDEQDLLNTVDDAFAQIIKTNAIITAHLNSLRKIKQLQGDIMKRLNMDELHDKINEGLNSATKKADETLEKLKQAEGIID